MARSNPFKRPCRAEAEITTRAPFRTLAGAKAALAGIETFRIIRKGQFENCEPGMVNEIDFVAMLFQDAA